MMAALPRQPDTAAVVDPTQRLSAVARLLRFFSSLFAAYFTNE
jgi:hypothetical protein